MRRGWGAVVVVLALAVVLVAPTPAARAALTLVDDQVLSDDGRLHELTLHSEALGGDTKIRVLLPSGYDDPANAAARYPMLLLVHGASGDQTDWTKATDVEEHTVDDDLIVVMPDGGATGFYSDWLNGPAWETYHLRELLPWVDRTYRTVGTREGRAVAGLSMGGFGAMSYAARHPDTFVAAAAFSGAVDTAGLAQPEMAGLQLILTPEDLWGPFLTHEANWRSHNPADLVGNLRGLVLRLATGTGVACAGDRPEAGTIEAAVYLMNVSFDLKLSQAGVAHEYLPRACGTHEWHYWNADLAGFLPVLMATFADPPAPPEAFDYRTAEPEASVWGWTFTAHRTAVELLDLHSVSPTGLTATGSGPLDVVTAPLYAPGATYTVATTGTGTLTLPVGLLPALGTLPGSAAPTSATATADDDGRLSFSLDLGPAHTANQFSPEGIVAEALALGSYFRTATVTITPVATPAAPPSGSAAAGPGDPMSAAPSRDGALPATGGTLPALPAVAAAILALAFGVRRAMQPSSTMRGSRR